MELWSSLLKEAKKKKKAHLYDTGAENIHLLHPHSFNKHRLEEKDNKGRREDEAGWV